MKEVWRHLIGLMKALLKIEPQHKKAILLKLSQEINQD